MAFDNFSGPDINITIRAQDKFSDPLKKIAKNTTILNNAADEMSAKVTAGSRKMTRELDFFETNSTKALKKSVKSLANFGGAFGNIAEDFSLGAGLMVGAFGVASSMLIKNAQAQDKSFLELAESSKTAKVAFSDFMTNVVFESGKAKLAADRIAELQNQISALKGSQRGGLGILDVGFSSAGQKESLTEQRLIEETARARMGGQELGLKAGQERL